jgi:hypothetical protein
MKRAASLKQEQDREYEAMVLKTTRLRELRLAKEAPDREAATPTVSARNKATLTNHHAFLKSVYAS